MKILKKYLKFLSLLCVCLAVCGSILKPVVVYASTSITPFSSMNAQVFEDGPWEGFKCGFYRPSTGANYGVKNWREGVSRGAGYYGSFGSATVSLDGYVFSPVDTTDIYNIVIWSYGRLESLYVVDQYGTVIADVSDTAFLCDYGNDSLYGVSVQGGCGVAFRGNNIRLSEMHPNIDGGVITDKIENSLSYVGGVYDTNSTAVRFPGYLYASMVTADLDVKFGYTYAYFPVVASGLGDFGDYPVWYFNASSGVLDPDCKYTFNFMTYGVLNVWMGGGANTFAKKAQNGNIFTFEINGSYNLHDLRVYTRRSADSPDGLCFYLQSSSSDDSGTIPPEDNEDGGTSVPNYTGMLSGLGNKLNDVRDALNNGVGTVVNNITYQTTQITNTITNTVTNMTQQITQGLSDVKQGITDKLQGVQQGITDKLGQVQDGINGKLEDVQDEIVNGYDNTGITQENEKLEQSINQYDEVESGIFEDAEGFIGDFEYPSVDSLPLGIIKALAFVGSFLQGIFLCMGEFSVIITFSLTMIFVMVVVGYHRIRS